MKPAREFKRLQKIIKRLEKKHPDWTGHQLETEATEILLGLKEG